MVIELDLKIIYYNVTKNWLFGFENMAYFIKKYGFEKLIKHNLTTVTFQ